MPLDRFALLLIAVIAAAGLTVLIAALVQAGTDWPGLGLTAAAPVTVGLALLAAVIGQRLRRRRR
mgnify:CR=1 FL=1